MSASTPATLDLTQIVAALERCRKEAQQLIAPLSPEQLNWQPENGKGWSIGQCIDHLAKSNREMLRAMSGALDSARARGITASTGPIRLSWIERFFVGSLEPPPKRRFKAPSKAMPTSTLIQDEMWQAFTAADDAVRDLALACRTIDINRIRVKSPFFRFFKYSLGAALAIIAAHNRRHLWQAQRVREATGFPTR